MFTKSNVEFWAEGDNARILAGRIANLIAITFPDKDTEKRALAFLLGRYSGRVLKSGVHLVPEAALEALADQNISFAVKGKATYAQQMAAVRGVVTPSVQWRTLLTFSCVLLQIGASLAAERT